MENEVNDIEKQQSRLSGEDMTVVTTIPLMNSIVALAEDMGILIDVGIRVHCGNMEDGMFVNCDITANADIYSNFKNALISNRRIVRELPGTQTLKVYLFTTEGEQDQDMLDIGVSLYNDLVLVEHNIKDMLLKDLWRTVSHARDNSDELISTMWRDDEYILVCCKTTLLPTLEEHYIINEVIVDEVDDTIVGARVDIRPHFCSMCPEHQLEWVNKIVEVMPECSNAVVNKDGSLSADPLYRYHLSFAKDELIRMCDEEHDS